MTRLGLVHILGPYTTLALGTADAGRTFLYRRPIPPGLQPMQLSTQAFSLPAGVRVPLESNAVTLSIGR